MDKYQVMPPLSAEEFAELKADIAERGVQVPIEYDEAGDILDGCHRVAACQELGIKDWPRVIRAGLTEEQKRLHARKLNLARRHLDREQKQELLREQLRETPEKSNRQIAASLGVDDKTVGVIREKMEADAEIPHQQTMITSDGKIRSRQIERKPPPVSIFMPTAKHEEQIQKVIQAAQGGDEKAQQLIQAVNDGRTTIGAAYSRIKRQEIKEQAQTVKPPEGKYRVIYADPPWAYGNTMPEGTTQPDDHYPLMQLEDICNMPIKDLSEDDAVLFLWVTSPILEESFQVINAWGFRYKSSFVWDKIKHNMGHYNSIRHEFLLIATRGSCQPDVHKLFDSVVSIERTEHSKKPEFFREIIDTIYPHGKRVELFARERAEGWDAYGNQLPAAKIS